MSRPGQVLADIYGVSRTTISRIKKGVNHSNTKKLYENLSLEERQSIYKIFCDSYNFYENKVNSTVIKSKRRLTEEQVHLYLLNEELGRMVTVDTLMKRFNIKSSNTLTGIKRGESYKDYSLTYSRLTESEKIKLASLLRNQ